MLHHLKKNQMHDSCLTGEDSWCGFRRDPESYKHKKCLPDAVVEFIQPVFDSLSSIKLLGKCLHGKTQNTNECSNKLIWDRCSKEYYVEKDTIENATFCAVSHFNDGRTSLINIFEKLRIKAGSFIYKLVFDNFVNQVTWFLRQSW